LHALLTLFRGITDTTRIHAVNTPLLAEAIRPAAEELTTEAQRRQGEGETRRQGD
jgi:hypothetical protein